MAQISSDFNLSRRDDENQILEREEKKRHNEIDKIKDPDKKFELRALVNQRDNELANIVDNAETRWNNLTVERVEAEKLSKGVTRLPAEREKAIERKSQAEILRETNGVVEGIMHDRNSVIDEKIAEYKSKEKEQYRTPFTDREKSLGNRKNNKSVKPEAEEKELSQKAKSSFADREKSRSSRSGDDRARGSSRTRTRTRNND